MDKPGSEQNQEPGRSPMWGDPIPRVIPCCPFSSVLMGSGDKTRSSALKSSTSVQNTSILFSFPFFLKEHTKTKNSNIYIYITWEFSECLWLEMERQKDKQHLLGKSLDLVTVIAIRVCTIITKRWLAGLHKKMSTSHLHSGVSSEKVTLHTIRSLIYFCLPFSSIKTPNNADPTKTRRFQEALK